MTDKIKSGINGENLAANYLVKNGYSLLERNYRHKHSEIDIIAKKEQIIVFVEVKARNSSSFGNPEEAVNGKKIKKIIEGAENYIYDNNWLGRIRFDIISVDLKIDKIMHFEDAFG